MKIKTLLLKRIDTTITVLKAAKTSLAPTGLGSILKRVSTADKKIIKAIGAYDKMANTITVAPQGNMGRYSVLEPRNFGENLRNVFQEARTSIDNEIEQWESVRADVAAMPAADFER